MTIDTNDIKNWIVDKTKDISGTVVEGTKKAYTITEDKLKALKEDYVDKESKILNLDRALDKSVDFICQHGCPCFHPCDEKTNNDKDCKACLKARFIEEARKEKG